MKLNLREPSFFIGHRGSVPLCPQKLDIRYFRFTLTENKEIGLHLFSLRYTSFSSHLNQVVLS